MLVEVLSTLESVRVHFWGPPWLSWGGCQGQGERQQGRNRYFTTATGAAPPRPPTTTTVGMQNGLEGEAGPPGDPHHPGES